MAEERGNNTNSPQINNPSFIPPPPSHHGHIQQEEKSQTRRRTCSYGKGKGQMVQKTCQSVSTLATTEYSFADLPSLRILDTAFKQQRLKAWQPILTPKSVLPTLLIIGIIFAPIGALIVWGSGKVTTITLDYTECDADAPTDGSYQAMPGSAYQCMFYARNLLERCTKANGPICR